MGAIHNNAQPIERLPAREGCLGRFNIAPRRIFQPAGAPKPCGWHQRRAKITRHQRFNLGFLIIRQLQPIGAKQLDAVILVWVVGSTDHHAQIGAERAREQRNGRRGQGPDQHHIHPCTDKAGCQRRFQHIAGKPGILADHNAVAVIAAIEKAACRLAKPECGGGVHRCGIGLAANAISAEKPAGRGCFAHARVIAPCRLRMKPARARQVQARRGVLIKRAGYSRIAAAGPSACRSDSGDRRWAGNTCPSAHRALVRRRCAASRVLLPLPPQRQGR